MESVTENDLFINQSQDKLYSYNDRLFVKPGEVGDTALFQRNLGIGNAGWCLSLWRLYLFPGFGSLNEKLFWLSLLVFDLVILPDHARRYQKTFFFHSMLPIRPCSRKINHRQWAVVLTSSLYIVDLADNNFFKELQELLNTNRLFIAAADGNRQQLQQRTMPASRLFSGRLTLYTPDSKCLTIKILPGKRLWKITNCANLGAY